MFDATKLLGAFLENRTGPSADRLAALGQNGMGQTGMGQQAMEQSNPGPLGAIASLLGGAGLGGAGMGGAAGGAGGLLGQLAATLQQGAGSARTEVASNNPVAVGGLGALAGAILGGGSGAVGGGVMAMLGSLAVHALQNVAANQAAPGAAPSAPATAFSPTPVAAQPVAAPGYGLPASHDDAEAHARLLLRAMISAAKADGQIDATEMQKIVSKLGSEDIDPATRQFVVQEMSGPSDIAGIAAAVRSLDEAVQVYAASMLAIEVDTPAERFYLTSLAQALHLPPETVTHVHGAMGIPV